MPEPMEQHTTRYPARLWEEAVKAAEKNDERISDVLRRALENYVKETNQ